MTNRKLAKRNARRPYNKKDGGNGLCRDRTYDAKLEAAGFTRPGDKLTYTYQGVFPVFTLAPGIVGDEAGLVAKCAWAGIEILFPYGTTPTVIKAQLDDKISEIIKYQADVADPVDPDFIPFMGEPVVPMVVEGQKIGPEIKF